MSRKVHEILRSYNELSSDDPESELLQVKTDIDRALRYVELTEDELGTLKALFLIEPERPRRTSASAGRPTGGATQAYIARLMLESEKSENALNIEVSRRVRSACAKLAAFLGAEYEDQEDTA